MQMDSSEFCVNHALNEIFNRKIAKIVWHVFSCGYMDTSLSRWFAGDPWKELLYFLRGIFFTSFHLLSVLHWGALLLLQTGHLGLCPAGSEESGILPKGSSAPRAHRNVPALCASLQFLPSSVFLLVPVLSLDYAVKSELKSILCAAASCAELPRREKHPPPQSSLAAYGLHLDKTLILTECVLCTCRRGLSFLC